MPALKVPAERLGLDLSTPKIAVKFSPPTEARCDISFWR